MTEETWLSFTEAVQIVRDRVGASVGRSQAIVREAISSGEIRTTKSRTANLYLIGDDGLEGLINDREADERATNLNAADLTDRLDRQTPAIDSSNPPTARRGGKFSRVERAARAIWNEAGPPAHLEPKVICTAIRARLKADEGGEPNMTDKTIRSAVRKIYK
jgi:hypothetical protein